MAGLGSIGVAKLAGYVLAGCLVVGGGSAVYLGALPTVRFVITDPTTARPVPQEVSLGPSADSIEDTATPQVAPSVVPAPTLKKPESPPDDPTVAFDLVRVEADGTALVAGRGEPGQVMDLTVDGETLGQVTADRTGQFVGIFDLDVSESPRLLELHWDNDGQHEVAPDSVIVAPIRPPQPTELAAIAPDLAAPVTQAPEATDDTVTDVATTGPANPAPIAPAPAISDDGQVASVPTDRSPVVTPNPPVVSAQPEPVWPQQPEVFIANDSGASPISPRETPKPGRLAIDSISYGQDGAVIVQGRSGGAGMLRLSLNGNALIDGQMLDAAGDWRLELQDVAPGRYVMRVDLRSDAGTIVARAETPFLRATPEEVPEDRVGADVVTVQPGFTLWRIARERYGEGTQYVQVFNANQDQIRDPDLIYPGQVLTLPQ